MQFARVARHFVLCPIDPAPLKRRTKLLYHGRLFVRNMSKQSRIAAGLSRKRIILWE